MKFSQLSSVTSDALRAGIEVSFVAIQSGANKLVSLTTLLGNLCPQGDIVINPIKNVISTWIGTRASEASLYVDGNTGTVGVNTSTPDPATKLHVYGNFKVTGVYLATVDNTSYNNGGQISLTTEFTNILQPGANATIKLTPGATGQIKTISWKDNSNQVLSTTITLTDCTLVGTSPASNQFSKITFKSVGQAVTLMYNGDGTWSVTGVCNMNGNTDDTRVLFSVGS